MESLKVLILFTLQVFCNWKFLFKSFHSYAGSLACSMLNEYDLQQWNKWIEQISENYQSNRLNVCVSVCGISLFPFAFRNYVCFSNVTNAISNYWNNQLIALVSKLKKKTHHAEKKITTDCDQIEFKNEF